MTPAKTPVWLPRRETGSIPVRSIASHVASSSNRCCASVATASRGLIPKKSGSKSPASCRKPPDRVYDVPGTPRSALYKDSTSHPRSDGNSDTASAPSDTSRHRSSGDDTPPG